jgi:cobaltochelatase CobN
VTSLIETGAWKTEDDLVGVFTDSMNHLYADNIHGERQAEVYRSRLAATELVSQVRDTHDYEIADLDHYYEYFGGLSRTITAVRGQAPVQLITDTTGERLRTETVKESLEHGLRTRLFNPKWIDGMLEHEVHGAQQISDRVQYLVGFAATTGAVDDWVFSAVAERFLNDPEMRDRLSANNPYAAAEIARRLSEAHRRGYWNADAAELERLRDAYLAIEGEVEDGLDF